MKHNTKAERGKKKKNTEVCFYHSGFRTKQKEITEDIKPGQAKADVSGFHTGFHVQ